MENVVFYKNALQKKKRKGWGKQKTKGFKKLDVDLG